MKKFLELLVGGTLVWAVAWMVLGLLAKVTAFFFMLGWGAVL